MKNKRRIALDHIHTLSSVATLSPQLVGKEEGEEDDDEEEGLPPSSTP
jgi:hypothetical protein